MKKHFKKLAATSLAFTAALALTFPSYAAGWVQSPPGLVVERRGKRFPRELLALAGRQRGRLG